MLELQSQDWARANRSAQASSQGWVGGESSRVSFGAGGDFGSGFFLRLGDKSSRIIFDAGGELVLDSRLYSSTWRYICPFLSITRSVEFSTVLSVKTIIDLVESMARIVDLVIGWPPSFAYWTSSPTQRLEVAGFDMRKLVNCLAVASPHPHLPVFTKHQILVKTAFVVITIGVI